MLQSRSVTQLLTLERRRGEWQRLLLLLLRWVRWPAGPGLQRQPRQKVIPVRRTA